MEVYYQSRLAFVHYAKSTKNLGIGKTPPLNTMPEFEGRPGPSGDDSGGGHNDENLLRVKLVNCFTWMKIGGGREVTALSIQCEGGKRLQRTGKEREGVGKEEVDSVGASQSLDIHAPTILQPSNC